MKNGWLIAFSVACGLLGGGLILLISTQPHGQPVSLLPAPTPLPIVVYVTGGVQKPGLCSLPSGSRLQDAIQAAGGLLPGVDAQSINLAALVKDGERILIPYRVEETPTSKTQNLEPQASSTQPTPSLEDKININTATLTDLDRLPGIGPALAGRIIAYRDENGPFNSIEDIQKVSGIGPVVFERIKDLITVENSR